MIYSNFVRQKMRHLQKIKYSSGYPVQLTKSLGKLLKDYKIYGNSIQDGTPTTESPIEVQSVGEKTINLLPYPYAYGSRTINGVTFTINDDRSITINGTATNNAIFYLYNNTKALPDGIKIGDTITSSIEYNKEWTDRSLLSVVCNYFNSSGSMVDGKMVNNNIDTSATNTIDDKWIGIGYYIAVYKGKVVDNLTIRPQLQLGNIVTPYEPYGKYKIPVTVRGANIINHSLLCDNNIENGVTFVNNHDGTITANGVMTNSLASFPMSVELNKYKTGIQYFISGNQTPGQSNIRLYVLVGIKKSNGSTRYISSDVNSSFILADDEYINIMDLRIYNTDLAAGYKVENIVFKPMISPVQTNFEPYREPVKINIYLDEPLRKVGDYADYVDFNNGEIIRNIFYTSLTEVFKTNINGTQYPTGFCRIQTSLKPAANYNIAPLSRSISGYVGSIRIENNSITLSDQYKNAYCYFLSDTVGLDAVEKITSNEVIGTAIKKYIQDNEIDIYYVLAEPIHTSIELPKIPTIKGTTIYEVDTTINPSNIEVKYLSK